MATTGGYPPLSNNGRSFIQDPKLSNSKELKASIKLKFTTPKDKEMLVIKNFQISYKNTTNNKKISNANNTEKLEFRRIEQIIKTFNENNELVTINSTCDNIDKQVPFLLHASKAILENVIFCHQEDTLWPFSDSNNLKKVFDEIFDTSKYTKSMEEMKDTIKKVNVILRENKAELDLTTKDYENYKKLNYNTEQMQDKLNKLNSEINDCNNKINELENEFELAFNEIKNYKSNDIANINSNISYNENALQANNNINNFFIQKKSIRNNTENNSNRFFNKKDCINSNKTEDKKFRYYYSVIEKEYILSLNQLQTTQNYIKDKLKYIEKLTSNELDINQFYDYTKDESEYTSFINNYNDRLNKTKEYKLYLEEIKSNKHLKCQVMYNLNNTVQNIEFKVIKYEEKFKEYSHKLQFNLNNINDNSNKLNKYLNNIRNSLNKTNNDDVKFELSLNYNDDNNSEYNLLTYNKEDGTMCFNNNIEDNIDKIIKNVIEKNINIISNNSNLLKLIKDNNNKDLLNIDNLIDVNRKIMQSINYNLENITNKKNEFIKNNLNSESSSSELKNSISCLNVKLQEVRNTLNEINSEKIIYINNNITILKADVLVYKDRLDSLSIIVNNKINSLNNNLVKNTKYNYISSSSKFLTKTKMKFLESSSKNKPLNTDIDDIKVYNYSNLCSVLNNNSLETCFDNLEEIIVSTYKYNFYISSFYCFYKSLLLKASDININENNTLSLINTSLEYLTQSTDIKPEVYAMFLNLTEYFNEIKKNVNNSNIEIAYNIRTYNEKITACNLLIDKNKSLLKNLNANISEYKINKIKENEFKLLLVNNNIIDNKNINSFNLENFDFETTIINLNNSINYIKREIYSKEQIISFKKSTLYYINNSNQCEVCSKELNKIEKESITNNTQNLLNELINSEIPELTNKLKNLNDILLPLINEKHNEVIKYKKLLLEQAELDKDIQKLLYDVELAKENIQKEQNNLKIIKEVFYNENNSNNKIANNIENFEKLILNNINHDLKNYDNIINDSYKYTNLYHSIINDANQDSNNQFNFKSNYSSKNKFNDFNYNSVDIINSLNYIKSKYFERFINLEELDNLLMQLNDNENRSLYLNNNNEYNLNVNYNITSKLVDIINFFEINIAYISKYEDMLSEYYSLIKNKSEALEEASSLQLKEKEIQISINNKLSLLEKNSSALTNISELLNKYEEEYNIKLKEKENLEKEYVNFVHKKEEITKLIDYQMSNVDENNYVNINFAVNTLKDYYNNFLSIKLIILSVKDEVKIFKSNNIYINYLENKKNLYKLKEEQRLNEEALNLIESKIISISEDISKITITKIEQNNYNKNIEIKKIKDDLVVLYDKEKESKIDLNKNQLLYDNTKVKLETYEKLKTEHSIKSGQKIEIANNLNRLTSEANYYKYNDIEKKYLDIKLKCVMSAKTIGTIEEHYESLDKALIIYHSQRMEEINKLIDYYWCMTYKGDDIERIEIRSDNEKGARSRTYNYRLVMISNE